jgi:uncharacterized protein YjiS (DUF1127 family)
MLHCSIGASGSTPCRSYVDRSEGSRSAFRLIDRFAEARRETMAVHGMSRKFFSGWSSTAGEASAPTFWLAEASRRLSSWLAWRADYRASVKELDALSDRDLEDVGMVRCDIPSIAKEAADLAAAGRR